MKRDKEKQDYSEGPGSKKKWFWLTDYLKDKKLLCLPSNFWKKTIRIKCKKEKVVKMLSKFLLKINERKELKRDRKIQQISRHQISLNRNEMCLPAQIKEITLNENLSILILLFIASLEMSGVYQLSRVFLFDDYVDGEVYKWKDSLLEFDLDAFKDVSEITLALKVL